MLKDRLKKLRKEKGITQIELSKIFGISQGTIGNWETGHREPDLAMLAKISNYFNVSIDYLVGQTEEPRRASDIITENRKGKILTLDDTGLAKKDLERISSVIDDIKKKYEAQEEPEVFAAHSDGHTQEEIDADLDMINKYLEQKKD